MSQHSYLNYRMAGDGHPVIFLHGFLESITMWSQLDLESLPFKSVLIDLPGHGLSPLTDDSSIPSLDFYAQEVKKLLVDLHISYYHVVGHSMGGYVALKLKEFDSCCKKVVLLNSNFWEDEPGKKQDRVRVADVALKAKSLFVNEAIPGLFYRHNRTNAFIKDLTTEAKKIDGVAIAYASLAMRNRSNKRELLLANPNDFLIIQGENDPLISPKKMQRELINSNVELLLFHQSGHMAHYEEPKRVAKILSDFLK